VHTTNSQYSPTNANTDQTDSAHTTDNGQSPVDGGTVTAWYRPVNSLFFLQPRSTTTFHVLSPLLLSYINDFSVCKFTASTFLLHFYMSVHKWGQVTNNTGWRWTVFINGPPCRNKYDASAQTSLKALTGRKT